MELDQRHRSYWHRNIILTGSLLFVWFVVTFVVSFYAHELNTFVIFGFPLGFYMGAQGSLLIYVAIIWFYAHYMNKMDDEYSVGEEGEHK